MLTREDPAYYHGSNEQAIVELVELLRRVCHLAPLISSKGSPVPEFGNLLGVLTNMVHVAESDPNFKTGSINYTHEIASIRTQSMLLEARVKELETGKASKEYQALKKLALWLEDHQK